MHRLAIYYLSSHSVFLSFSLFSLSHSLSHTHTRKHRPLHPSSPPLPPISFLSLRGRHHYWELRWFPCAGPGVKRLQVVFRDPWQRGLVPCMSPSEESHRAGASPDTTLASLTPLSHPLPHRLNHRVAPLSNRLIPHAKHIWAFFSGDKQRIRYLGVFNYGFSSVCIYTYGV